MRNLCAHPLRAPKAWLLGHAGKDGVGLCLRIRLAPGRGQGCTNRAALGGGGKDHAVEDARGARCAGYWGIAASSGASAKDLGRSQGPALDANWVLLETRAVDLKKEKERFTVGAGKGRFRVGAAGRCRPPD